jgi:hypothetical protein
MFDKLELVRLRALANQHKLTLAQYVRMLVAREWSNYESREQEAKEWLLNGVGHEPSVKLEDLTDQNRG